MKFSQLITIAIADDHELIRIGMKHLLSEIANVKLLFEASNGEELISQLSTHTPDIIFMDINMPIIDGLKATEIIRNQYPYIKIVVLTANKDTNCFQKMIKLGVQGFIHKTASAQEIRTAILQVHNGIRFISNDLFDIISEIIIGKEKPYDGLFSPREKEILELLCQGIDTKDIATKLFLSQRTIEKHKSNMMAKTTTNNTIQLILFAIKNNIVILQ